MNMQGEQEDDPSTPTWGLIQKENDNRYAFKSESTIIELLKRSEPIDTKEI
jgi:hypothetical protein